MGGCLSARRKSAPCGALLRTHDSALSLPVWLRAAKRRRKLIARSVLCCWWITSRLHQTADRAFDAPLILQANQDGDDTGSHIRSNFHGALLSPFVRQSAGQNAET
jgi:hypothetical protein